MAVLVEAISVIVKVEALQRSYPGGWEGYRDAAPNATFCCDPEITRIGFMQPDEVRRHVEELARHGIQYLADDTGAAVDLVVMDQLHGPAAPCTWAEFGHVAVGPGDESVAAARLADSRINVLMRPVGWTYEKSLSKSFKFVSSQEVDRRLANLGTEGGISHWVDRRTGKDYFSSAPQPE